MYTAYEKGAERWGVQSRLAGIGCGGDRMFFQFYGGSADASEMDLVHYRLWSPVWAVPYAWILGAASVRNVTTRCNGGVNA